MLAAAKYIGAGLAAIGLTGAAIWNWNKLLITNFKHSPKPSTTRAATFLIRYSRIRSSRSYWAFRANGLIPSSILIVLVEIFKSPFIISFFFLIYISYFFSRLGLLGQAAKKRFFFCSRFFLCTPSQVCTQRILLPVLTLTGQTGKKGSRRRIEKRINFSQLVLTVMLFTKKNNYKAKARKK